MASRSLGTLTLDLIAKIGGFTAGLTQAERVAADRTRRIERHFQNMQRVATGVFAFFAGSALTKSITQAIDLGDQLNKAAIQAGVTAESISELAYAAKLSDVEITTLSTSLRVMQTNLSEAASGSKSVNATLAALGLTIADLRGLSADKQFELLADRINDLQDASDKARAATEIFGRAGASLLPLFEQGAEGIRKAREEAERLGLSFSGDQLKTLATADDSIKSLKASFEGLAVSLATKVSPSLSYFLDQVKSFITGQDIDRVKTLREEIRVLEDSISKGGGGFFTPFVSFGAKGGAPDVEAGIYSLEEQIAKVGELRKKLRILTSTGRGGTGTPSADLPPGFAEAKKAEDTLTEVIVTASKIRTGAMEQYYEDLDRETQTSTERQLEQFAILESGLNELFASGRIGVDVFNARIMEGLDELIPEVVVTAKKIGEINVQEAKKANEFILEAARGTQDILADTLFGAMEGKIDNIETAFVKMINQLVAQALAAKLAEKLFGPVGKDGKAGGGGLVDLGLDWLGGFFGGGKASGGSAQGGTLFRVNEYGTEALAIPGRSDYLMTGRQGGEVIPANRAGRGGGSMTQNIIVQGRVDQRTARQMELDASRRQRVATARLA